jgi:hypothetical protein
MPARNPKTYLRKWLKKHPGYNRNRMRIVRGTPHAGGRGQVRILGCSVRPCWMPIPAVTREQANEEFLRLTQDMEK